MARPTQGLDGNGYVAELTDPAGATQGFTTNDRGLITAATDARDNGSQYRAGSALGDAGAAGDAHDTDNSRKVDADT